MRRVRRRGTHSRYRPASLPIDEMMALLGRRRRKSRRKCRQSAAASPRAAAQHQLGPSQQHTRTQSRACSRWNMRGSCRAQGRQIDATQGKSRASPEDALARGITRER